MSILCSLYRLTEQQSKNLLVFPEAVSDLLGYAPPPTKSSFLSRIFGKSRNDEPSPRRKLDPVVESETLELNQAWHILHYLLSGSDAEGEWPSAFIMSGGHKIGPDLGYGPARLLNTELSKEVADFLSAPSRQALNAAYVAQDIQAAKIYWQVASEPNERQRQIEELWSMVQDMRTYFDRTAQAGSSILVHIY
ncbi:protein of unknown function (DUF1877) [Thiocystis violascens DSM 198]|uniref:DUF1877 family protein n=2 Tax=Thiocystis violascens TaxID=73141 RepID=I3YBD1_THIV6|nr:protein of unknown function (DUF1877) [Thiocystis violascens DSM 198]